MGAQPRPQQECPQAPGQYIPVIKRNRCEGKEDCVAVCPYDVFEMQLLSEADKAAMPFLSRFKARVHGNRQAFARPGWRLPGLWPLYQSLSRESHYSAKNRSFMKIEEKPPEPHIRSIVDPSALLLLEMENCGLRRLVIELLEKNQQLRDRLHMLADSSHPAIPDGRPAAHRVDPQAA